MLNEMLGLMGPCPVCGRYYHGPHPNWWCPYCGPSLSMIAIKKIDKITERLNQIESQINEELPIQSIPLHDIDDLFD